MVLIETGVFTRQIAALLDEQEQLGLQLTLVANPGAGKVIRGSGGIRKLRWGSKAHGKRGGIRVIYYWVNAKDQVFLLAAYAKSETADLSPSQIKILRALVEQEFWS